jgi:hypothetical protein
MKDHVCRGDGQGQTTKLHNHRQLSAVAVQRYHSKESYQELMQCLIVMSAKAQLSLLKQDYSHVRTLNAVRVVKYTIREED